MEQYLVWDALDCMDPVRPRPTHLSCYLEMTMLSHLLRIPTCRGCAITAWTHPLVLFKGCLAKRCSSHYLVSGATPDAYALVFQRKSIATVANSQGAGVLGGR